MALFMRQDDNRTEMQRRIAAELTEKAKKKSELENKPRPDGVDDSVYVKDIQKTGKYAGVWLAAIVLIIISFIIFVLV